MKYLTTILEKFINKKLYHGSPYKFSKFNDQLTFFTDSIRFATEYSDQKSMDRGIDNDTNIYEVEVKTNLFDISNKEDYDKLEKNLPSKISFSYNNFGFEDSVKKKEFMFLLKGYQKIEPFDFIKNVNVNDVFPNPEYDKEKFIVIGKDDNYIYTKDLDIYNDRIFNLAKPYVHKYSKEEKNIFSEIREYVQKIINNNTDKYINDNEKSAIVNALFGHDISRYFPDIKVNKKDIIEFKRMLDIAKKELNKYYIKDDRASKFVRKTKIKNLKNTWRFYENDTVINTIKKLGYGGYIAKEDGIDTYAIFNPLKDVEIITYKFDHDFKSFDEYKEYKKLLNWIYKNTNKKFYDINDTIVYNLYSDNLSKEEILKAVN